MFRPTSFLRPSSRLGRPRSILTALGASATVALGVAPTAGATSLAMWPNFECWHYANNTATMIIDKPSINSDGYTTSWATQIQLWTSQGWMNYYKPAPQTFQDTSFGELEEQADPGQRRREPVLPRSRNVFVDRRAPSIRLLGQSYPRLLQLDRLPVVTP